jgi:thiosulfate dehydrogenase [quinone] large subunit
LLFKSAIDCAGEQVKEVSAVNWLRWVIWAAGAIAVLSLVALVWTAINLTGDARTAATWIFWISFIVLVIALYLRSREQPGSDVVEIEGPPFARFLLSNRAAGLVWLPIRVFLGYSWLDAGLHKLTGTGWVDGGSALLGYWNNAVAIPAAGSAGHAAITYGWYRDFLQIMINNNAQTWFGPLITLGEIAVGLGLIFGALTGIAAFFGALMNVSYLLAGSTSSNPVLFTFAIGVMLAWRVAGYYGLDRYLLPMLGTPWRIGSLFHKEPTDTPSAAPPA